MTAVDSAPNTALVREIPVNRIHRSTFNPRQAFDIDALDDLALSIQQHGLIEPIVVRPHPTPELVAGSDAAWEEHYEIIAGERRWRAAVAVNIATIPAMVRDVDDATAIQLAVVENLQRADLDPIEEAAGFQLLLERAGMTQRDAAAALNRSQPAIANALRLLRLPTHVQQLISEGDLSRAHGVALMRFDEFPAFQEALADVAVSTSLSSKQLEKPFDDYDIVNLLREAKVLAFYPSFDECENCPFSAKRKGKYHEYCLNPEHYEELQEVRDAAREAERAERLAEVEATGDLPSVRDIGSSQDLSYALDPDTTWSQLPPGCGEDCPCRCQVLNWNGDRVITVCADPDRYRDLEEADKQSKVERKKAALAARLEQLEEKIDELPALGTITPDELIVLAGEALARVGKKSLPSAVAARQGHPDLADHKDWSWRTVQEEPEIFEQLSSLDIIKFALEVVLRNELLARYEGYASSSPLSDFYLGDYDEGAE